MSQLYYDDLNIGDKYEFDGIRVSKEEIVSFGHRYDPLPFHTNEKAALDSIFDGLIASGLQTLALSQKQIVDHLYEDAHILGGFGFEEVLFPNPVRPEDVLYTSVEVIEKRLSESDPSRGIVTIERTVAKHDDVVVLTAINNVLFQRNDIESMTDN